MTSDINGVMWNTDEICGWNSIIYHNMSSFMEQDGNTLVMRPNKISQVGRHFITVQQRDGYDTINEGDESGSDDDFEEFVSSGMID